MLHIELYPAMAFVRHIFSYCLIIVVLVYVTPLQQLFKLPALLEHYKEHKKNNSRITFSDFIFMHYIGDDGVADDNNKDMQLPFKKANIASFHQEAYSISVVEFIACKSNDIEAHFYPPYRPQYLPDPNKGSLLKPPRV